MRNSWIFQINPTETLIVNDFTSRKRFRSTLYNYLKNGFVDIFALADLEQGSFAQRRDATHAFWGRGTLFSEIKWR